MSLAILLLGTVFLGVAAYFSLYVQLHVLQYPGAGLINPRASFLFAIFGLIFIIIAIGFIFAERRDGRSIDAIVETKS